MRVAAQSRFRARAGISCAEFNQIDPDAYVALINDDEAFEKFLTDDHFALATIKASFKDNTATEYEYKKGARDLMKDSPTLGPIYTGVTPASGS